MRRSTCTAAATALVLSLSGAAYTATAQPAEAPSASDSAKPRTAAKPHIARIEKLTPTRTALFIESVAMKQTVQVQVLHPEGSAPRPSLYLLDGVGAGEESDYSESTWTLKTDAVDFFADKDVNVVMPVGGTAGYYTDWLRPDPKLGHYQWETFLTEELPQIVDDDFHGNGTNAVAGVSMGAMGAANLATRHPSLYVGLTSFSGCLDNSDPTSRDSVRGTVAYKGGDPANMWGVDGDPAWNAHNPTVNAEALRGKQVYISTGNGAPGPYEAASGGDVLSTVAVGGPLEAAANVCTKLFQSRLDELRIPATVVYHPYGTHSWPYWQDEMHRAWPEIAAALKV
ncbi:alpha/beta hydrolase family protein [Rhodococcus sp. HNM0569]|uniref:alpha/beta hydrolase n=1 Tax=Rhodococcus sp. HNM0569 TaxID=2716340 RepID=UPI00146DBAC8|nr:alpha/beta hydrolase family protein [Rhodococcus sp. HNM0569]NLU83554.1 esterase family protein [Rhodococcus sp. HNM0569]